MLISRPGEDRDSHEENFTAGTPFGSSVCAVTVTYGERRHLLRRVLASLLKEEAIRRIVVVSNGAQWNVRALAREVASDTIEVVELGNNFGFGAGFAAGIKRACELGPELIWLLDDDNEPQGNALAERLVAYASLRAEFSQDKVAVVALRPGPDWRISAGLLPAHIKTRPSSSWSFHVFDVPSKIWHRTPWGSSQGGGTLPPLIETEVGPYGGLLFHRDTVKRYGLPRQDFILYRDDLEFTHRIPRDGGAIRLVTSAIIDNLDPPWYASRSASSFQAWLEEGASDMRVFYEARNRTHMDSHCLPHNRLMYWFNRHVYCTTLRIFVLALRRMARFRLLQTAIGDGMAGRRGIAPRFPLP